MTNPYLDETGITKAGRAYLDGIVTDTTSNVYALTSEADSVVAAAAMARLSRSPLGFRELWLSEFTDADDAGELLKRVVTGFGDDSVQQLISVQLVVEGASNLLTKALEHGRLASYLEQSTRYIFFDQKVDGRYKYHVPAEVGNGALRSEYERVMDTIFDRYSRIVRELTDWIREHEPLQEGVDRSAWLAATRAKACDAVRPILPVATKSTVGIAGSAQAVDNLIMYLLSLPYAEAQTTGRAIYEQAAKVIPAFLERTMREDRGLATVAYRAQTRTVMKRIWADLFPEQLLTSDRSVKLIDHWPHWELDLLPEMLFLHSHLSLEGIERHLEDLQLGQEEREAIFRGYMGERLNRRHKPDRAIEKAHFEWEIVDDYGTFRDLQRHRMVDAMEWQELTPHYGYEVPPIVAEAGLEHQFRACFDDSSELFGALAMAEGSTVAQYATLLGHRMSYRFITNLRELFHLIELRTGPAGHPGYRRIGQEMYAELAKVYPLSAEAMRFVNQGEDEALGRLAAERASAFQRAQLGLSPETPA